MAALQHLSARQRAVLILRDVLEFSAAEAAEILDATVISVNSSLRRARASVEASGAHPDSLNWPSEAEQRVWIDRYMRAFVEADIEALKQLLAEDVLMEMPPMLNWFVGRRQLRVVHGVGLWGGRNGLAARVRQRQRAAGFCGVPANR